MQPSMPWHYVKVVVWVATLMFSYCNPPGVPEEQRYHDNPDADRGGEVGGGHSRLRAMIGCILTEQTLRGWEAAW